MPLPVSCARTSSDAITPTMPATMSSLRTLSSDVTTGPLWLCFAKKRRSVQLPFEQTLFLQHLEVCGVLVVFTHVFLQDGAGAQHVFACDRVRPGQRFGIFDPGFV